MPVAWTLDWNTLWWAFSCPLCGFLPLLASQTSISWPFMWSCSRMTSPGTISWLSSWAQKPNCRARNHHTVLWRTSGLLASNSPVLNSFSSLSVSARVAYRLFPLPALFARFLRLAARTFLDFSNSLSLRMLIFTAVVSVKCLCILLWTPESASWPW